MTSLYDSLKPEALNELVATDLMDAYKFAECWEDRDAIRKVVKIYTTTDDYKLFEEKCVES